jgi:integrase
MDKRKLIPDHNQYNQTLTKLIENGETTCLVAIRLGCEMGMSRIEIVNARISDIDRYHTRGLWIEVAKKVKRGKKFIARKREVPINPNLYQLLKTYSDKDQNYILQRKQGDINKPFIPRYINTLYEKNNIPWSTHKSRHYFKNKLTDWMRKNRQVDMGLVKELMGHKKTVTEDYGSYSWDYMRDIIDKVDW